MITPSAMLLFEENKHHKNLGMLIAWATLHSLDRVRRNVTVRPEMFTLLWKSENESQTKPWSLNLIITQDRHEQCLG